MSKLLSIVILVACSAPTRPRVPAVTRVTEADANAAYDAKHWPRCAQLFEALGHQSSGPAREIAFYNAACCHARGANPDRAFALLDRAVKAGMSSLDQMPSDPDLATLHVDPRWAKAIAAIEHNAATREARIAQSVEQPAVRRELLALAAEDQRIRFAWIAKQDDAALGDAMLAIDRKTTARMKAIVAAHGWPGKRLVGDEGANAAWLLVQHADQEVEFQKQCLALLEKAVAAGDASPKHYAYLYDRVAVAEHRPQRWGTQFAPNREPQPIEDEARVDERRKQVGLEPMAAYKQEMLRRYGAPKQ